MRVIPKNARETIRVQMAEFRGTSYLDVRTWADTGDGEPKPTPKGVTVPLAAIAAFAEAVAQVVKEAGPRGA